MADEEQAQHPDPAVAHLAEVAAEERLWRISRERLAAFDRGAGATISVDDYFAEFRRRITAI